MTSTAIIHRNNYDKRIIVLLASLAFGYAGGLFLSPTFIITILFVPSFLAGGKALFNKRPFSRIFYFALIWILYSTLSLLWTPNVSRGVVTLAHYVLQFLMFLELIVFFDKAKQPLDSISDGWLIAVLFTTIIALWEIQTNHHLYMARVADGGDLLVDERGHASVLLYNSNTYSLFLVMAFPFLLYRFTSRKKIVLTVCAILLLLFVVIRNGSRGAILSLGVMILVFSFFSVRSKTSRRRSFVILTLFTILIFIIGSSLFSAFIYRMETQGLEDNARFEIWAGAWELFVQSNGVGQGVGSMGLLSSYNHLGIEYAHCLLLESLLEGGIVITSIIVYFLLVILVRCVSEDNTGVKIVLLSSLLSFPLYSIINSGYLQPAFIWCFFISVYIFSIRRSIDY